MWIFIKKWHLWLCYQFASFLVCKKSQLFFKELIIVGDLKNNFVILEKKKVMKFDDETDYLFIWVKK